MKKIPYLLYISLMFIVTSCDKEKVVSNSLDGSWELRQTSAAMMPTPTNYPVGNGTTLNFKDGTYQSFDKGVLVKSGNYEIVEDSSFEESVCLVRPQGQFHYRLIFDGNTAETKQFFEIINGRLSIFSGCYAVDAGTNRQYEKVNEKSR